MRSGLAAFYVFKHMVIKVVKSLYAKKIHLRRVKHLPEIVSEPNIEIFI